MLAHDAGSGRNALAADRTRAHAESRIPKPLVPSLEPVPVLAEALVMERLSGLDASFLYFETPTQLLHMCELLRLGFSALPEGYRFGALDEVKEVKHAFDAIVNDVLLASNPSVMTRLGSRHTSKDSGSLKCRSSRFADQ
ncbi:MAG: hypothetical protein ACRDQ5_21150 [Sciscionella sp.]